MKIEKNIPITRANRFRIPFDEMENGDSVFVPEDEMSYGTLRVSAHKYGRKTGKRMTVRKQENGCRVWRVE